jgi:hypothetical protein
LQTLTELSQIVDLLNRQAFASLVGHIDVVTFRDFERGEESYGFVGGLVVPYNRLMGILTAKLFSFPAIIALDLQAAIGEAAKTDPILRVWDKISIPTSVDASLRSSYYGTVPSDLIGEAVYRTMLNFASDATTDEGRAEAVGLFIDRFETALFESRVDPIPTMGLKRLHEYPRQGYDWDKIKVVMRINYDEVI